MADRSATDMLQPALLDRLTDNDPAQKVESKERRAISMQKLRESVRRDLAWLLSTGRMETLLDLDAFPEIAHSVLNYGIPDISGAMLDSERAQRLETAVRDAILHFEPRLNQSSLKVSVTADPQSMQRNALVFQIEAELWGRPLPQSIVWKSELDLESGSAKVSEADR
ncbi:MAG: type VI secretion system baseplate subunit TssE [Pseudomonadota bacterium]